MLFIVLIIILFFRCSLWLRYAFLTREQSVILVNTIGATLQLAYIVTFYVYTINKTSVMRQFLATLLLIITSLVYAEYEKNAEKVVKVMGKNNSVLFATMCKNVIAILIIRDYVLLCDCNIFWSTLNNVVSCYQS